MRKGHTFLALCTGIIGFGLASSSFAAMSAADGWYLEGNVGSSKVTNRTYSAIGSSSSNGMAGNINLGYKFMPYVAAEIGYTQYAKTTIKDQFNTKAGQDRRYSYDIAMKAMVPVANSGLEPFAKIGVSRINSKISLSNPTAASNIGLQSQSRNANGLYLAAGVQYYFIPEMALNVQWARAKGNSNTGTMDLISGGVSFLFD